MDQEKVTITITDSALAEIKMVITEDEAQDLNIHLSINKKAYLNLESNSLYAAIANKILHSFGEPIEITKL